MSMVMGFDGIDDYVNDGAGASLDITAAFTFDFWIKLTGDLAAGYHTLVSRGTPGVSGYSLTVYRLTNLFVLVFTKLGVVSHYSSYAITLFKNTHICVTYNDTTGDAKFYADGTLIDTINSATHTIAGGAVNTLIGGLGVNATTSFQGYVYSVKIYNRILALAEIQYNMAHPNNPIKHGLVLNLTQESLIGGVWKDLSGNSNDGTLVNHAGPNPSNNLAGRQVSI